MRRTFLLNSIGLALLVGGLIRPGEAGAQPETSDLGAAGVSLAENVTPKIAAHAPPRSLSGNPYPGPSMSDQSVQVESIRAKCSFEPIPGP